MNVTFKIMTFKLKMMNFRFKMMTFILKMMNFSLKMPVRDITCSYQGIDTIRPDDNGWLCDCIYK